MSDNTREWVLFWVFALGGTGFVVGWIFLWIYALGPLIGIGNYGGLVAFATLMLGAMAGTWVAR